MLLLALSLLAASSLSIKSRAAEPPGTSIGVRKEGPLRAAIGDAIEYTIIVYNLGEYWIRNTTIMDVFPNGTTATWIVSDVAPLGQAGDSINISRILYTIETDDVFYGESPYVLNHAEVAAYVYVGNQSLPVRAETNFPTFIMQPVVGGYAIHIRTTDPSAPTIAYVIVALVTATFAVYRHNRTREKRV